MTNQAHDSPYVMNSFLHQFPELVMMRGGNLQTLCHQAELPIDAIMGAHQLIPFEKFIRLLEVAETDLNYPDVALGLAARQDVSTLGPMSILMASCTNFQEAILKIMEYLQILLSGFHIEIKQKDTLLELIFHVNLPGLYHRKQFQNYLLAGTVVIIRGLLRTKTPLRACFFTRPEPDLAQQKAHSQFFGCPVAFGADEIKITIDSAVLMAPIEHVSKHISDKMALQQQHKQALGEKLIDVLNLSLAAGEIRQVQVAQLMGYSERTFRRRLKEANISFRDTLDALRLSQANKYLQSTHYSLHNISVLLGYANQSAFTRSYRRWCGMSPKAYRDRLHRD